jgi:hypothetical protein
VLLAALVVWLNGASVGGVTSGGAAQASAGTHHGCADALIVVVARVNRAGVVVIAIRRRLTGVIDVGVLLDLFERDRRPAGEADQQTGSQNEAPSTERKEVLHGHPLLELRETSTRSYGRQNGDIKRRLTEGG